MQKISAFVLAIAILFSPSHAYAISGNGRYVDGGTGADKLFLPIMSGQITLASRSTSDLTLKVSMKVTIMSTGSTGSSMTILWDDVDAMTATPVRYNGSYYAHMATNVTLTRENLYYRLGYSPVAKLEYSPPTAPANSQTTGEIWLTVVR